MEFRILGPLEVVNGDGFVALPGQRLRALLATFLLHPNVAISSDKLAQALWGEDAPATSLTTVRVHVSRLRRALEGDADLLATSPGGYQLRVRPGELDSERFTDLVATARDALPADPDAASAALREALALWRGAPLADLASASCLQAAIARLEAERLDALELRIEADLAMGRHTELVPELQALVDLEPQREHLYAQLMLSLYRSGRQTEALEVFRRLRAELVDALALEPGPETRELEAAILRQDPALDPPRRPGGREQPHRAERRPRMPIVLGTAVAVATGMAVLEGGIGGAAPPAPESEYRAQIVRVCRSVNAAERVRLRDEAVLGRALEQGTPGAKRVAILIATRAEISRSGRNFADLRSLVPPAARRVEHLRVASVWSRNLDRIRRVAVRVDGAAGEAELRGAIAPLTAARPAIERDLVTLTVGLQRLGGEHCRIHGFNERPVLLSPLGPDVNPPPTARLEDGSMWAAPCERPASGPAEAPARTDGSKPRACAMPSGTPKR